MAHKVSKATEGDHRIYELEVPPHTLQPLAHILHFEPPLDASCQRSDVIRPIKILSLTHTPQLGLRLFGLINLFILAAFLL